MVSVTKRRPNLLERMPYQAFQGQQYKVNNSVYHTLKRPGENRFFERNTQCERTWVEWLLLLLRGGIVQNVPRIAAILWSIVRPYLSFNHSWFIHQSFLVVADTPISETGSWRRSISIMLCKILLHAVKSYDMGPSALYPIGSKVCCGILSTVKIHHLCRVWTSEPWVQWQAHSYPTEAT
jgi:hypothetical protein